LLIVCLLRGGWPEGGYITVVLMCPLTDVSPGRRGYRRSETAAAALVVAPDSGYLSRKMRAEAITCAFPLKNPRMGKGIPQERQGPGVDTPDPPALMARRCSRARLVLLAPDDRRVLLGELLGGTVGVISFLTATITSYFVSVDHQAEQAREREFRAASDNETRALLMHLDSRLAAIENALRTAPPN
jgi:hypothetical protein